jgi:hypothetical protein
MASCCGPQLSQFKAAATPYYTKNSGGQTSLGSPIVKDATPLAIFKSEEGLDSCTGKMDSAGVRIQADVLQLQKRLLRCSISAG